MTNKMITHGMPSWSELMTSDPKAATIFYAKLFNWQYETMDMPDGEYYVASVGEEKVAGIMAIPDQAQGTISHWQQYFTVDNADVFASRVAELQGVVVVPPTDIPGVGRFLMFQDPQGATLSALQYIES